MSKNILLCSLGTSPMVVPQAFLAEGTVFDEVHVITTDNPNASKFYQGLNEFFVSTKITFTFTIVKGISLPITTSENERFGECLFQWYMERGQDVLSFVCLSGGTKTVPAIMQKAAQTFGAKEVFHVISNKEIGKNPENIQEIEEARRKGQLEIIRFGSEVGWNSLRHIAQATEYKPSIHIEGNLFEKESADIALTLTNEIKEAESRLKVFFEKNEKSRYPFQSMTMLPNPTIKWIYEPLCENDKAWLLALPKVELHCHLGGFATQPPLLDEIRKSAEHPDQLKNKFPINNSKGWPSPKTTIPLNEYMKLGDNNGSAILSDPGCLKRQVQLLYQHLQSENIRYAEIRCSPYNYSRHIGAWEVLDLITGTFQHLMDNSTDTERCHVNIIIIVTRKDEGDLSSISKHLALAITSASNSINNERKCRVVGVDLAGFETKATRASYFEQDFRAVHRCGLAVTAHAGENDDAEGIWQAVFRLSARRIGHALNLWQAKDLIRTFSDRRIAVEMCPYANFQIKGFYPMEGKEKKFYPLMEYLKEGIPVTVNTDNIGISCAGLTDNLLFLHKLVPGIKRIDILKLIRNSIDVAFINESQKEILRNKFDKEIFKQCLYFSY